MFPNFVAPTMDYSIYSTMTPPKYENPFKSRNNNNNPSKQHNPRLSFSQRSKRFAHSLFSSNSEPPEPFSPEILVTTRFSFRSEHFPVIRSPVPNPEFDDYLDTSVQAMKTDYTSGARQMADNALSNLATLMEMASETARNRDELWTMSVQAGKALCAARPSMNAATTSCILRTLSSIHSLWDSHTTSNTANTDEPSSADNDPSTSSTHPLQQSSAHTHTPSYSHSYDPPPVTPKDLSRISSSRISQILTHRSTSLTNDLAPTFVHWTLETLPPSRRSRMHILTLSNSSTIRGAIAGLFQRAPTTRVDLTILESRPRCEGADLATSLLGTAKNLGVSANLNVRIVPDCAIAGVLRDDTGFDDGDADFGPVDFVLLGADRISADGDVSNKIGSLAAVMCAKAILGSGVWVVVVSDVDKIVSSTSASSPASSPISHFPAASTSVSVAVSASTHTQVEVGREEKENHASTELSTAWSSNAKHVLEKGEEEGRVEVFGDWFEWVESGWIDVYITEMGVLDREDVSWAGERIAELERKIFGGET